MAPNHGVLGVGEPTVQWRAGPKLSFAPQQKRVNTLIHLTCPNIASILFCSLFAAGGSGIHRPVGKKAASGVEYKAKVITRQDFNSLSEPQYEAIHITIIESSFFPWTFRAKLAI